MNKYLIRFNKSRGQAGRGTPEHVWRVFENGNEFLVKNFKINTLSFSEIDASGLDWNLCCYGYMALDKETSTAIINIENKQ